MFWRLLNCTIVLVMVFSLIGIGTMVRYSNAIVPSRTITVNGEGKAKTTPDIATDSFSVISQGSDPTTIQRENTLKMNAAIEFLKTQGIKAADIQTSGYNLYPRYSYDKNGGSPKIEGYEVTNTVTFKVRDLEKIGVILTGLVKAGVNQTSGLQYSIENPEGQRDVARQEAFANAYLKASQMAAQNGVRIARVITFSESSGYGGPILYAKAMSMDAGMGGAPAPTMEPGSQETTVNVSVTYEIR